MPYLLDANVFSQAKRLHYGFDFCPAFWEWLERRNGEGTVFSIEKVGDEVEAVADELSEWAEARGSGFFVPPDSGVIRAMGKVSAWAKGAPYDDAAVNTFLQVADYYLVGHALAHGHTVVTHERVKNTRKKVQIPEACAALKVKCMTPFEMLRKERARFVLPADG